MKSEFRKFKETRKERAAKVMAAMQELYRTRRFDYGTQNAVRLRKALALEGFHHLHNRTLLSPEVHAIHAERLAKRYLKKLAQAEQLVQQTQEWITKANQRYGPTVDPHSITAHNRLRFVTVLDSVEVLDPKRVLRIVHEFKAQLQSVIEGCRGIWCLGAIEVEVVSMEMMRKLKSQTDSEKRKLEVLESMLHRLPKRDRELSCYFLIHFHGIVAATRQAHFDDLERHLKQVWKQEPRQVLLKPLSKVFKGKPKTPRKSLVDIARYITKGGNDWYGKKAYLRYKVAFDNEQDQSLEAWENRNWRQTKQQNSQLDEELKEELRREHKEEGVEDVLSMTRSEICALAQVIDGMMGWTRNRTGYLVCAGSKRKKLTTTGSETLTTGSGTLEGFIAA